MIVCFCYHQCLRFHILIVKKKGLKSTRTHVASVSFLVITVRIRTTISPFLFFRIYLPIHKAVGERLGCSQPWIHFNCVELPFINNWGLENWWKRWAKSRKTAYPCWYNLSVPVVNTEPRSFYFSSRNDLWSDAHATFNVSGPTKVPEVQEKSTFYSLLATILLKVA